MPKTITFITFILLFNISHIAFCQSSLAQPLTAEIKEFERAKQVHMTSSAGDYEFVVGVYQYHINRDGSGSRSHKELPKLFFDLDLLKEYYEQIDSFVYFAEFKRDVLLICGTKLDDSGSGIVRRLSGDSLKIKWKQRIKAFNIGPGLIKGNYAYLTAIGFVGKINLATGKYAWKHEELYRSGGSYNSFQLPALVENRIRFQDKDGSAIIEVDDHSGKIIRMDR